MEEASQVLKEAVDLQPDYPNITKIARMFFEERNDWMSAIELAKRESLRTESPVWFERLKSYIHRGYTATLPPAYFTEVLTSLLKIDPDFLEKLSGYGAVYRRVVGREAYPYQLGYGT